MQVPWRALAVCANPAGRYGVAQAVARARVRRTHAGHVVGGARHPNLHSRCAASPLPPPHVLISPSQPRHLTTRQCAYNRGAPNMRCVDTACRVCGGIAWAKSDERMPERRRLSRHEGYVAAPPIPSRCTSAWCSARLLTAPGASSEGARRRLGYGRTGWFGAAPRTALSQRDARYAVYPRSARWGERAPARAALLSHVG